MVAESSIVDVLSRLTPRPIPRIFLHFFDTHFLEERGASRQADWAFNEAKLAMRFAVMLASEVILPASSYFESPLCKRVVDSFDREVFATQIVFTGGGGNLAEFIEDKLLQYNVDQAQGHAYRATELNLPFPWRKRTRSSTADIIGDWQRDLASGRTERLFNILQGHLPRDHDIRWERLPGRLGKSAFIVENVVPLLFGRIKDVSMTVKNRLHEVINRSYFSSFARDTEAAVFQNMAYLNSPELVPSGDPRHDVNFRLLERCCREVGIWSEIMQAASPSLRELAHDQRFKAAFIASNPPPDLILPAAKVGDYDTDAVAKVPALIEISPNAPEVAAGFAPKVLIVTALPKEAAAVQSTLDSVSKSVSKPNDKNLYRIGTYVMPGQAPDRRVLLATLPTMGLTSAAARVATALQSFPSVEYVLMVGIAGGCPNPDKVDEHVRLGDIVFSNSKGIFDYSHVKKTTDGSEYRANPQVPSAAILQAFNNLTIDEYLGVRPWEEILAKALEHPDIKKNFDRPADALDVLHGYDEAIIAHPEDNGRREGMPKIFGGAVASSNTLNKDPKTRDQLRDDYDVRAIEMEGSGVFDAGWANGKQVAVVRGICDYCDKYKNDEWQQYAALVAAAFTRSLIEEFPSEWFT